MVLQQGIEQTAKVTKRRKKKRCLFSGARYRRAQGKRKRR